MTAHVPSLFMCAYTSLNKQNKTNAKHLVLQSIDLKQKSNENLFLEPTEKTRIKLLSSDRFGVDLELVLIKKSGKISIEFHKKRSCSINITFMNCDGESYNRFQKGFKKNVFIESLLSEFPAFVRNYIANYNKKWKNISKFAFELIQSHTKNNEVNVCVIADEMKVIAFNQDPLYAM